MLADPPRFSPFWAPHVHADRRPILLARGRIVAALRAWFAGQDFVEVDTAALQVSPGNEIHLHAFATALTAPDGTPSPRYLRTSPEFACKKLLAAGERRIVEFAKVFRNRERGALHHPEFTLVEWYRAGESYETLMGDCVAILRTAARAAGTRQLTFRGRAADAFAEPERLSVAEAFTRFAGIDLIATLPNGVPDRERFAAAAQGAGIRIAADDTWGDIFSRVLVERIEGNLGDGRATILDQYPAALSALARQADDPRVAERLGTPTTTAPPPRPLRPSALARPRSRSCIHSRSSLMPSLVMLPFIQCHHTRGRAPLGGFSNPFLSGSNLLCAVAALAPSKSTMMA